LKKTYEKKDQRFGKTEDGREVGPLTGGANNIHPDRIEYKFGQEVYWEDLKSASNPDPEENDGWI
jgi:hypothetical protein